MILTQIPQAVCSLLGLTRGRERGEEVRRIRRGRERERERGGEKGGREEKKRKGEKVGQRGREERGREREIQENGYPKHDVYWTVTYNEDS